MSLYLLIILQRLNISGQIDTKDFKNKESWREWMSRQRKDNKLKWIGGTALVVSAICSDVYYYNHRTVLSEVPSAPPEAFVLRS
jgi:hypothetical protein